MGKVSQLDRDGSTVARLLDIWTSAVGATHTFLSGDDVASIRPEVCTGLVEVEHLYGYRDDRNVLQGFIGVSADKVEMLFVDAGARGKGIGKQLLRYAMDTLCVRFVDVNEQNEQGAGFYRHMGFCVIGRSEQDEQGRPFPLLHLGI